MQDDQGDKKTADSNPYCPTTEHHVPPAPPLEFGDDLVLIELRVLRSRSHDVRLKH